MSMYNLPSVVLDSLGVDLSVVGGVGSGVTEANDRSNYSSWHPFPFVLKLFTHYTPPPISASLFLRIFLPLLCVLCCVVLCGVVWCVVLCCVMCVLLCDVMKKYIIISLFFYQYTYRTSQS